jgi:hypothetical protein
MEAKQGSCPQVMQGVTEEGHRKTVCGDQKCKVHKHQVQQPLTKGQSAGNWEAQQKEREAQQKVYVESERPVRLAVYAAIRPKLRGAKLLRAAASAIENQTADRSLSLLRGLDDPWTAFEHAKDADLEGWLADMIAAGGVEPNAYNADEPKRDRADLWALGKLVSVDCDAIAKKATPPVVKAKPAPAKKAAAKPAKQKARKQLSAEGRKRIAEAMKKRWTQRQKAVKP